MDVDATVGPEISRWYADWFSTHWRQSRDGG